MPDAMQNLAERSQRIADLERREIIRLFRELCGQPLHQFPTRRGRLCAPNTHGVYIIRDPLKRVLDVGRTIRGREGLHQRLRNHLYGSSSFTDVHLGGYGDQLREACSFQYLEVNDARKRALLEAFATGWLCPAHLGTGEAPTQGEEGQLHQET